MKENNNDSSDRDFLLPNQLNQSIPENRKEVTNGLWSPSNDFRDFQLNIAHTHRKTWTVTGKVEESSVVETAKCLDNEDIKYSIKRNRRIIWNEELTRKHNPKQESDVDPLVCKEQTWIADNTNPVVNIKWKNIRSKIFQENESNRKELIISQKIINSSGIGKNDELLEQDYNSLSKSLSILSDASVYLKHLDDKVSLKILERYHISESYDPHKGKSIPELLNQFMFEGKNVLPPTIPKYGIDSNPTNESLRDRMNRCIRNVCTMIRNETVNQFVITIIEEILEGKHRSNDVLSKGVLRGILDVNEGNKRFLKASGKLLLLRGIIDDFSLNHRTLKWRDCGDFPQQIDRLTSFSNRDLLTSIKLKIEKEKGASLFSQFFLQDNVDNENSYVIREIVESNTNDHQRIFSERLVHEIPLVHQQGFHDLNKLEAQRLVEKIHVHSIHFLKVSGMSSSGSGKGASLVIEKSMGKVATQLLYPDYENQSSILIVGTTIGKLLCYRIPWCFDANSSNSNISRENVAGSKIEVSDDRSFAEFLAANRQKSKKGEKNEPSEILSLKCSPIGPSYVLSLNKDKRVVLWSLQHLFHPVFDDRKSGTIKQRGIFNCFYCTGTKTSKKERYIERLGTIDNEELLYRFRMKDNSFELYGKDSLRPFLSKEKARYGPPRGHNLVKSSENKTMIMKVMRSLQLDQSSSLQDYRMPTTINFFGSVNENQQATSLVVGCDDGEIMKINLDFVLKELRGSIRHPLPPFVDREFINPTQSPANFIVSVSSVAADVNIPITNKKTLTGNRVFREIFHWHRAPVTFIETIDKDLCQFLSIDEDGIIAKWHYDPEHFTGSCWFVPDAVCKLPHRLVEYEVTDNEKESVESLNELFNADKEERDRFQHSLRIASVSYKELHSHARASSFKEKDPYHRKSMKFDMANAINVLPNFDANSVNTPLNEFPSSVSAGSSTVINILSPRELRQGTEPLEMKQLGKQKDKKYTSEAQKKVQITTVYHPIPGEEAGELVQYEETTTLKLVQMTSAVQNGVGATSSCISMNGIPYVLKSKTVEWNRSFLTSYHSEKGSELTLVGRKLTSDGLELVHVFRRISDSKIDKNPSVDSGHFVVACLRTSTLTFRFPLSFFSLHTEDEKGIGGDKGTDEVFVDFDCGPIMRETQTRILFLLTSKGIRQFGLHTAQQVFFGADQDTEAFQILGNEGVILKNIQTSLYSKISFRPSKICLCPSQRLLLLTSEKEARMEIFLLQHRLDGCKVDENTAFQNKSPPLNLNIIDLLNLGEASHPGKLEEPKGSISDSIAKKFSQPTIINQCHTKIDRDSEEIALSIIEYVLEVAEDFLNIKNEEKRKKVCVEDIFGVNNLGFIPPTSWPLQALSKLDQLIQWRIDEAAREAIDAKNEQAERFLMKNYDKLN